MIHHYGFYLKQNILCDTLHDILFYFMSVKLCTSVCWFYFHKLVIRCMDSFLQTLLTKIIIFTRSTLVPYANKGVHITTITHNSQMKSLKKKKKRKEMKDIVRQTYRFVSDMFIQKKKKAS